MSFTYKKIALNGVVRSVLRSDGVSFLVPVGGEFETPFLQSVEYAQFKADGGTAADPDIPPLVFDSSRKINSRVRTTNATPTEVYRATLATLTMYDADLKLRAVDAVSGACRRIHAEIVAKRLNGGALMVGSPVVIADQFDAAASTWGITAAVAGNDFVITVTGAAGRTIDWMLSGDVESFTPGGA